MCVDGLKELQVVLKDKKMLDIIEATTTLFRANFPLPQVGTSTLLFNFGDPYRI